MKHIKIIILLLLLIIGINSVKAERIFNTTLKVYDYAQVLTEKEEDNLKISIDKYIEKYNIDMVLVTVKHYKQDTLEEYMDLFYNTNKFSESGIMIVLDLKNNNTSIKTFGIANNLYSKVEITDILNKLNKKTNTKDKLSTFIKYSNKYITTQNSEEDFEDNIFISINWILITIISLILSTIIIFIGLFKTRNISINKKTNNCVKSIEITTKQDLFVTTNTKKTKINQKKASK